MLLEFVLDIDEAGTQLCLADEALPHNFNKEVASLSWGFELVVLIVPHQSDDLLFRKSLVGDLLAEEFPDDDSKAVDVCELVDLFLVADDLRGHPLEGAEPALVLGAFLLLPRESEIAELDLPVFAYEDIRALEVAVQDLLHVVQVDHALNDVEQNLHLLFGTKPPLLTVQLVEQAPVLQVLGDKSVLVSSDTHAHIKHDVGMFQVAYYLQFLHEVLLVPVLPRL